MKRLLIATLALALLVGACARAEVPYNGAVDAPDAPPPPPALEGAYAAPPREESVSWQSLLLDDGPRQGVAICYERTDGPDGAPQMEFPCDLMDWLPDTWRAADARRPQTLIHMEDVYVAWGTYSNGQTAYRRDLELTAYDADTGMPLWWDTAQGEYPPMELRPGQSSIGAVDFDAAGELMLTMLAQGEQLEQLALAKYMPALQYEIYSEDDLNALAEKIHREMGGAAAHALLDRLFGHSRPPTDARRDGYLMLLNALDNLTDADEVQAYYLDPATTDDMRARMLDSYPRLR